MKATFTVSGPGFEATSVIAGGALLRAQRAAEQAEKPGTFYVRNGGADALWQVERLDSGVVETRAVRGREAENGRVPAR